jgi:hypothetical protein
MLALLIGSQISRSNAMYLASANVCVAYVVVNKL